MGPSHRSQTSSCRRLAQSRLPATIRGKRGTLEKNRFRTRLNLVFWNAARGWQFHFENFGAANAPQARRADISKPTVSTVGNRLPRGREPEPPAPPTGFRQPVTKVHVPS